VLATHFLVQQTSANEMSGGERRTFERTKAEKRRPSKRRRMTETARSLCFYLESVVSTCHRQTGHHPGIASGTDVAFFAPPFSLFFKKKIRLKYWRKPLMLRALDGAFGGHAHGAMFMWTGPDAIETSMTRARTQTHRTQTRARV
jgi:hypothetical protein